MSHYECKHVRVFVPKLGWIHSFFLFHSYAVIHSHISQWWCNMTQCTAQYSITQSMIHVADALWAWPCMTHIKLYVHPRLRELVYCQMVNSEGQQWLHQKSQSSTTTCHFVYLFKQRHEIRLIIILSRQMESWKALLILKILTEAKKQIAHTILKDAFSFQV